MNTLCELFLDSARRYPNAVLVHQQGVDWTYEKVRDGAIQLASWLREQSVQPRDRVGILVPNSADYVISYFGTLLAGAVAVALNPETTPRELSHTLAHSEPTAVIASPNCEKDVIAIAEMLPSVRAFVRLQSDAEAVTGTPTAWATARLSDIVQRRSAFTSASVETDDLAQIIYTSGTTGRPKGAALSHRNLVANCRSIIQYLEIRHGDSVFVVLPFFYSYGNSLLLTHVAAGGRLVLAGDFVFWNRALDLMESQDASGFSGVPSTFAMLLGRSNFKQRRFQHLRYLTCAGGALAPALVKEIRQAAPHVRLFLMYGQTEASARISTLLPEHLDDKAGSIGNGIPGVNVTVRDETGSIVHGVVGEIYAQGENIMTGYWKDPDATKAAITSWGLRTGDMARMDEDGFIYIAGRRSDIIKSGGYRIHPKEIEEVILELPAVAEAAVVGFADEIQGEVTVAFVVLRQGAELLQNEDILQHCAKSLPRHKHVRRVHIVGSLPKTSSGKVKRNELKAESA